MPLSAFQTEVAQQLAANRSPGSHLAGAAALMLDPQSPRMSDDLDYFHDEEALVAQAYDLDRHSLIRAGFLVTVLLSQPGFIRAVVTRGTDGTKVEWAHDSAWRFFPAERDPVVGYRLHSLDLAINKVLALVGRDEPRDFLDTIYVHEQYLPLAGLCWAAVGKDPGFNPVQLVELLARKGRYREEDFAALQLTRPIDLQALKRTWLAALQEARRAAAEWPADQAGVLYFDPNVEKFVSPSAGTAGLEVRRPHRGGIIPRVGESDSAMP